MTYKETIEYLYNSTPVFEHVGASAYKEGLENTWILDENYGHPHRQYQTIHVAGTNGKGSCSHTIASILQEAGYKVGLYTSPHLVDFRERIRVNGQCISEKYVVDFIESLTPNPSPTGEGNQKSQGIVLRNKCKEKHTLPSPVGEGSGVRLFPSFFELTTALAFKYFADEQIDRSWRKTRLHQHHHPYPIGYHQHLIRPYRIPGRYIGKDCCRKSWDH